MLDSIAIRMRVEELGAQITQDYRGRDLRLVTVLKGGLYFLSDLARAIDLPLTMDFMAVSPYTTGAGGVVRVTKDLSDDIGGSSVLLVEDVVDTGLTVNYVLSLLRAHNPAA
jgi:hypoxanthine phosphoribosyltransferase